MMDTMTENKKKWKIVYGMIDVLMKRKKSEEIERQEHERRE